MVTKHNHLSRLLFAVLLLALVTVLTFAAAVPAAHAEASVVPIRAYICLTDSGSNPLVPGASFYKIGSTAFFNDGMEGGCLYEDFPATTTNVEVWTSYNGTTSPHLIQDISDANQRIFNFQTQLLTLRMETCGLAPLDGGNPRFGSGSTYTTAWFPGGVTGSSAPGETQAQFFPGTYSFEMTYKGTADRRLNFNFPADGTLISFKTTALSLYYSGAISMGGPLGDSRFFAKPTEELLPGTYKFHFRPIDGNPGYRTDLTYSGCAVNNVVNLMVVKDHNGAPIAGATARGGFGASYGTWHVAGSTDAAGVLADIRPVSSPPATMSYEVKVNSTTANKTQDVSTNSVFAFQTQLLTARLETCAAAPLNGANVRWGNGPTFTTRWFPSNPAQPTGTSAPGETAGEAFPGTYSFEMLYKATAQQKLSHNFPLDGSLLTWQTTAVTINYPGSVSYGGTTGDSTWFTKPTMELLPGTYKFHFRPYNGNPGFTTDLTFSGCAQAYTVLRVVDENGSGVPGAQANPACGGSWQSTLPGVTDAGGNLLAALPACTTKVKMIVNQGSEEKTNAEMASANYTWTTQILRLWLLDHAGAPITDGQAILEQGGGYWYTWGNLNASGYRDVQLLPRAAAYKFKMSYNFNAEEQFPVVPVTAGIQDFYFQTGQVFGPCITQYQGAGWSAFTNGMEQMPGTRTFRYPSQSGTVTAGAVTNLDCPVPLEAPPVSTD